MFNPVQLEIIVPDGEKRFIIIEPILQNSGGTIKATGSFKIFKDTFGEESALFTEPREINETGPALPDDLNPDYLGLLNFTDQGTWHYDGELLSSTEQEQVVAAIQISNR